MGSWANVWASQAFTDTFRKRTVPDVSAGSRREQCARLRGGMAWSALLPEGRIWTRVASRKSGMCSIGTAGPMKIGRAGIDGPGQVPASPLLNCLRKCGHRREHPLVETGAAGVRLVGPCERGNMQLRRNPGRATGLVYLVVLIFGVFALMYVPGRSSSATTRPQPSATFRLPRTCFDLASGPN